MEYENEILKELPLRVKEMLNDAFALDIITEVIQSVDNVYLKKLLGDFVLFFASIFTEEVIDAEMGDIEKVSNETLKLIHDLRMKNLKSSPTINSKTIKNKEKDMGIDFEHYVFDTVITVDENSELYDINFRTWEYDNLKEEYFLKLNQIARTPSLWSKRMLIDNIYEINIYQKLIKLFIIKKIKNIKLTYKSYPSSKLFNTSIKKEEKLYIAQRYGLAKSICLLDEIMKDIPEMNIGLMYIDIKKFLRKAKAVLFGIMWNDYKNTNFNIIKEIFEKNKNVISEDFYQISTNIRNNIHYKTTNPITKKEIEIFDSNEKYYMKNILEVFNKNMSVKFNFNYKLALYLAKIQYDKDTK